MRFCSGWGGPLDDPLVADAAPWPAPVCRLGIVVGDRGGAADAAAAWAQPLGARRLQSAARQLALRAAASLGRPEPQIRHLRPARLPRPTRPCSTPTRSRPDRPPCSASPRRTRSGSSRRWRCTGLRSIDQDFPFPYMPDLDAWHRWPLASVGYLFFWAAAIGLVIGWRRWWQPGTRLAWTVLVRAERGVHGGLFAHRRRVPVRGAAVRAAGAVRRRDRAGPGWLDPHSGVAAGWRPAEQVPCSRSGLVHGSRSGCRRRRRSSPGPPRSCGRPATSSRSPSSTAHPPDRWTIEQRQTYTVRATNLGRRAWSSHRAGQVMLHIMFVGHGRRPDH